MKDAKLLDETLISLLRMPEAARTPEVISSHLALATSAAGLKQEGATGLQLEHMKLAGAVARLAADMGEGFTHRTSLRLGPDLEGIELFASIEAICKREIRFTGFGGSAERVLAQLRHAMSQHGKTLSSTPQKPKPRWGDRDPLRRLRQEAQHA
ncbi:MULTISPECIES: hypothetical protein [unclassified Pseudomonas]|uniref:hypothetical protein n=1 Tax=unclassified Pseudomonas TaxID=196821 RepID=UPI002449D16F|nr:MULTISPECIES: hypothetical protein [unclassified Pseudomonas]MDG9925463.1 hypothetical protein [Pseudomonas sp. GD04045]MDH0034096.1 hypothetical protein [Pseudomonas sp. GD04019]